MSADNSTEKLEELTGWPTFNQGVQDHGSLQELEVEDDDESVIEENNKKKVTQN